MGDVARLCEWRFFHAQACALTCAPRLICPIRLHEVLDETRFLLAMLYALGWDDNILAQWKTDNEYAVLLTYPPDAS